MIRINLLPFRAARKTENIRYQMSMFLLSLVLIVTVMVGVFLGLSKKLNAAEEKVKNIEVELKKYKKKAKEVDSIKKKLGLLEKKTEVMVKLDKNREEPARLLDILTEMIIANRMWLTKMTISGNNIKISGIAMDNKTCADFMKRLEKTPFFSNVSLKMIKHNVQKKQKMKSFEITLKKTLIKPTATEAKKG